MYSEIERERGGERERVREILGEGETGREAGEKSNRIFLVNCFFAEKELATFRFCASRYFGRMLNKPSTVWNMRNSTCSKQISVTILLLTTSYTIFQSQLKHLENFGRVLYIMYCVNDIQISVWVLYTYLLLFGFFTPRCKCMIF